jgi:ribose/xylose/arabinose/galactoside ABC-type transport system permease subunit
MTNSETLSTSNRTDTLRRIINILGEQGFIVIFAFWAIYLTINTDNFATSNNVFTVLRQASIIGICAIGAHFIILLGDIDLSVAAVLTLAGVVMAKLLVEEAWSPIPAGLAAIGLGMLIGLINGLIITQLKINAIITTLGMSTVLGGFALTMTKGKTVFGDQIDPIEFLSRDKVLDNLPVPVVIMFVLYGVAFIVLRYTAYGARLFAVGNNDRAAWLSGINVDLVKITAYILSGGLGGFGGVMQVARQGTATGTMGGDFLFPILTAVVLGGASLSGGRGRIFNTLIAAIFLTTITNGMVLLGYEIETQRIVSGVILIVALSLDRLRTLRL